MLDWPLYTPSPNRECLYKVASPGKTPEKTHVYLEWPLYTPASGLQDFDPETEQTLRLSELNEVRDEECALTSLTETLAIKIDETAFHTATQKP